MISKRAVTICLTEGQAGRVQRLGEAIWKEEYLGLEEISKRLLLEYLLWAESERGLAGKGTGQTHRRKMEVEFLGLRHVSDIGHADPVTPAVDDFSAAGRALEVGDSFHFDRVRPVTGLALHQDNVGGANGDDIEDSEGGSVANRLNGCTMGAVFEIKKEISV